MGSTASATLRKGQRRHREVVCEKVTDVTGKSCAGHRVQHWQGHHLRYPQLGRRHDQLMADWPLALRSRPACRRQRKVIGMSAGDSPCRGGTPASMPPSARSRPRRREQAEVGEDLGRPCTLAMWRGGARGLDRLNVQASLPNLPLTTFPSGPPGSGKARPPDQGAKFGCRAGGQFSRAADNCAVVRLPN